MSEHAWESLTRELCALSGWPRAHAEEALASVLCILDQSLFGNGKPQFVPMSGVFKAMRRCRHHRGVRPRALSRDAWVAMVAKDLECSIPEAENVVRKVLEALSHQLSEGERAHVRVWLPGEVLSLWPEASPSVLQP
jgi:uncharacterized protein (DUF2267 family)